MHIPGNIIENHKYTYKHILKQTKNYQFTFIKLPKYDLDIPNKLGGLLKISFLLQRLLQFSGVYIIRDLVV